MSMILILAILTTGLALAQSPSPSEEAWTESVTYRGDGIFVIDFIKDIPWRTQYLMTLTDAAGNPMTYIALGGDAGEAVVRAEGEIEPDALYTFTLIDTDSVFYAVGQSTAGLTYANSCEYCLAFGHDERDCAERIAAGVYETVRCDLCGTLGHEDDFCPTRRPGAYCDECGEYGHDDDVCVYDDDDDPYDRCDLCGAYGHDEDRCTGMLQPTPQPKSISGAASGTGLNAVSSTPTPQPRQEYCDECGEYGHDDDNCPNERCDECGKTGHDDDNCPNERCDECGKYGHDDDNCPNERCDECGKYGHDDDNCPNERNHHKGHHDD